MDNQEHRRVHGVASLVGRALLLAAGVVVGVVGLAEAAGAFEVQNHTDHTVETYAKLGNGEWKETIGPGGRKGCRVDDCHALHRDGTVDIRIAVGWPVKFACTAYGVTARGGIAQLTQIDRTYADDISSLPDDLVCVDDEGFTDPPGVPLDGRRVARHVRFLATADAQYFDTGGDHETRNVDADQTIDMMRRLYYGADGRFDIRGLLHAGDTTQFSRNKERNRYKENISRSHGDTRFFDQYWYDGIGNHDTHKPRASGHEPCWYDPWHLGICPNRTEIAKDVAIRWRATRLTADCATTRSVAFDPRWSYLHFTEPTFPCPHYSWDWHDVHFVQLNILAGDRTVNRDDGSDEAYYLDPLSSLDFLKEDLAQNVGTSGRPVVIVQHLHPNECGEWQTDQCEKFWDVIAPYNVIAMIVGHEHGNDGSRLEDYLVRPASRTSGPAQIPAFIAGAARHNRFLDITIGEASGGPTLYGRGPRADFTVDPDNDRFLLDPGYSLAGLQKGSVVRFAGRLPKGVAADRKYYVVATERSVRLAGDRVEDAFKVSTTPGGPPVALEEAAPGDGGSGFIYEPCTCTGMITVRQMRTAHDGRSAEEMRALTWWFHSRIPSPPAVTPSVADGLVTKDPVTVSWSALGLPGFTVEGRLDTAPSGPGPIHAWPKAECGGECVLAGPTLDAEGSYSAVLFAADANGKQTTSGISFAIDRTAPKVRFEGLPERSVVQDGFRPRVVVDEAHPDRVELRVNGKLLASGPPTAQDGRLVFEGPLISDEGRQQLEALVFDRVGLDGRALAVVIVDRTPPSVDLSVDPSSFGWVNRDVHVQIGVSDALSGVDRVVICRNGWCATTSGQGTRQFTITSEGEHTVTFRATDVAGNVAEASLAPIRIDKTPPVIDVVRTPPNEHGWNNTDVTVTFDCSDALSGVAACPPSRTLSGEGAGHQVTGVARDQAGNEASRTVGDINIDKTKPRIELDSRTPANGNGWNNEDVTVSFSCSDALSGIDSCTPDTTLTSEAAGQSVTGEAVDKAGNRSGPLVVADVNIDKTAPVLECGVTPSRLWPPDNKLKEVTASVAVRDELSGSAGFLLRSVVSSQPDELVGPKSGDIQGFELGTADVVGSLRAQRDPGMGDRTYTLTYAGADRADNVTMCAPAVVVPKSR